MMKSVRLSVVRAACPPGLREVDRGGEPGLHQLQPGAQPGDEHPHRAHHPGPQPRPPRLQRHRRPLRPRLPPAGSALRVGAEQDPPQDRQPGVRGGVHLRAEGLADGESGAGDTRLRLRPVLPGRVHRRREDTAAVAGPDGEGGAVEGHPALREGQG